MTFVANTRVQVVRPDQAAEDEYGDPIATPAPAADSPLYKASITEKTRLVFDETSGMMRTIRYAVGRVTRGHPTLATNDVLTDQRTGRTWVVDELIDIPRTTGGTSDVRVVLKGTSGA